MRINNLDEVHLENFNLNDIYFNRCIWLKILIKRSNIKISSHVQISNGS